MTEHNELRDKNVQLVEEVKSLKKCNGNLHRDYDMLFSNYRELETNYKEKQKSLEEELTKTTNQLEDEK